MALLGAHGAVQASPAPDAPRAELPRITHQSMRSPLGDREPRRHGLTDDAVIIDELCRITHKADTVASLHPFLPGLSGWRQILGPCPGKSS